MVLKPFFVCRRLASFRDSKPINKSELPSEDELGAFGVEGTQNAEKDGDG